MIDIELFSVDKVSFFRSLIFGMAVVCFPRAFFSNGMEMNIMPPLLLETLIISSIALYGL